MPAVNKPKAFEASHARDLARAALDVSGEFSALELRVMDAIRSSAGEGSVSAVIKAETIGRLERPGHCLALLRRRLEALGFVVEIRTPMGGVTTLCVSW